MLSKASKGKVLLSVAIASTDKKEQKFSSGLPSGLGLFFLFCKSNEDHGKEDLVAMVRPSFCGNCCYNIADLPFSEHEW